MEQGRKVYKFLVRKPEVKRPLGNRRRKREDRIRMDPRETGGGANWIRLAQDGTGSELSLYIDVYILIYLY
jgi:hypothetical protein